MSDYSAVAPPQNLQNQSSAFAAAIQRAKQIAAKITPINSGPNEVLQPQKRSLEESSEPEPKKPNFGLNNIMAPANKFLPNQGHVQEEIMIPGPKVGLIIGKGGEMIKQLQEKSGAKMIVIQEGPNIEQEKPLRISGDSQKVEHAKQLVYEILGGDNFNRNQGNRNQNRQHGGMPPQQGSDDGDNRYKNDGDDYGEQIENSEVLVPKAAVGVVIGKGGDMIKKIQAETGAKVQFHQGRDEGPGDRRCFLSGKPQQVEAARQRVEELIDSVLGGGNSRNRNNDFNNRNNQRNGGPPGGPNFNGGNNGNGWNQPQQPPMAEYTFRVPVFKCGVIIGRGGETIKQINQQTGAHCELDRRATAAAQANGGGQEKIFILRGDPECVENAKRCISDKLQMNIFFQPIGGNQDCPPVGMGGPNMGGPPNLMGGPGQMNGGPLGGPGGPMGGGGPGNIPNLGPGSLTTAYPGLPGAVPAGPGAPGPGGFPGQQPWSGAAPGGGIGLNQPQPGGPAGAPLQQHQPEAAGGAPMFQQQQWGQQPQQSQVNQVPINPHTGQPDYSKQWAEYYRSLGMHREADMIEQQAKASQAAAAAAAGGPNSGLPSATQQVTGPAVQIQQSQANVGTTPSTGAATTQAQPDYSAQWAEYYRSIGKVKEAEAVEAQMKLKANVQSTITSGASSQATPASSAIASSVTSVAQSLQPAQTLTAVAGAQPFPAYANYSGYYGQAAAGPGMPGAPGLQPGGPGTPGGVPAQYNFGGFMGAPAAGGGYGATQPSAGSQQSEK